LPPVHQLINSPQKAGAIVLPPYSLTVVRSTSAQ